MDQQTRAPARVYARLTAHVAVTIRPAERRDLAALEWGGMFAEHREIIAHAWESMTHGLAMMLVADASGYPVGQAWIDLERCCDSSAALVWAVRVLPGLQRVGIGSALLDTAETLLYEAGYGEAEIRVEPRNAAARRLYERRGYIQRGRVTERFEYVRPDGVRVSSSIHLCRMRKPLAESVSLAEAR